MTLTEDTTSTDSVVLVSTNQFRVMTVTATIGHCLSLEVVSFVAGVVAQAIQGGDLSGDSNRDFGPELNITTNFPEDNLPDIRMEEAEDASWDASTIRVIINGLVADKLADYQQLLIGMLSGDQKVAATGNLAINARQIQPVMAKLLLDDLAYLVDTGSLLLGHSKKMLHCLYAVRTRLMTKAFSGLKMHRINLDLSDLRWFIER